MFGVKMVLLAVRISLYVLDVFNRCMYTREGSRQHCSLTASQVAGKEISKLPRRDTKKRSLYYDIRLVEPSNNLPTARPD